LQVAFSFGQHCFQNLHRAIRGDDLALHFLNVGVQ
jgi:hypothetical protein